MDLLTEYAESLGYDIVNDDGYGLFKEFKLRDGCDSWTISIIENAKKLTTLMAVSRDWGNIDCCRFRDETYVSTFEAGKLYIDSWHFKNLQFIK